VFLLKFMLTCAGGIRKEYLISRDFLSLMRVSILLSPRILPESGGE